MTFYLTYIYIIFWHSIWHKSDIYSAISSGILSFMFSAILSDVLFDILSDIRFDILSDINSDIPSAIHFDILSGILSNILSEILPRILSYIVSGIGFGQLATEWLSKGFWQTSSAADDKSACVEEAGDDMRVHAVPCPCQARCLVQIYRPSPGRWRKTGDIGISMYFTWVFHGFPIKHMGFSHQDMTCRAEMLSDLHTMCPCGHGPPVVCCWPHFGSPSGQWPLRSSSEMVTYGSCFPKVWQGFKDVLCIYNHIYI